MGKKNNAYLQVEASGLDTILVVAEYVDVFKTVQGPSPNWDGAYAIEWNLWPHQVKAPYQIITT